MTNNNRINFEQVLSDAGMPVTESQIQAEFLDDVKAEGLITNTSKMSPFWRLINALLTKSYIELKDNLVDQVMPNSFLLTMNNWALDLKGDEVNITRKSASAAIGYVTFIKADKDAEITIKAGTIIQSPKINGEIYQVATINDTTIKSEIESERIKVQALETGAAYNLASGYYRILAEDNPDISQVYNDDNWLMSLGADIESDDDFRERIRNQFNLVGHYHTDAVYKGLISELTGVAINQIFFKHEAPRGPGTANVYLLLNDGENSQEFINKVNDYIMQQDHRGHGDDLECFTMPEIFYDVRSVVYFYAEQEPADLDAYLNNVADFIRCAFRQNQNYNATKVNAFSRFSISNLDRELHNEFKEIQSIEFNIQDIISELSVPRLQSLEVIHQPEEAENEEE